MLDRPARSLAPLAVLLSIVSLVLFLGTRAARAQEPQPLPDLTGIVKDDGWARILGKALFWDTVASASGSDCASCHFVTGANRRIPDQSEAPLQLLGAAAGEGPATHHQLATVSADDPDGIVDVCSRHVRVQSAEMPDFGPLRTAGRVADEDPSCQEDLAVRLAHSLLERKPLEDRTINPSDGTFGREGPHGNLVSPSGRGLERTYQWMIEQAFEDFLWKPADAQGTPDASIGTPAGKTTARVERNFPLFWGIALRLYESTLDPHWARDHEIARSLSVPASTHGRAEWE